MKHVFIFLALLSSSFCYGMCSDYSESTKELFDKASDVLLVKIQSAKIMDRYDYEATYEIVEKYKGSLSKIGIAKYQKEPHSILLTPGMLYLFFFRQENFVSICNGSRDLGGKMDVINELRLLSDSDA